MSCLDDYVRNLGIFILNLIQKNSRKIMTTNMCELLVANMMNMNIPIMVETILNFTNLERELYLAEGPMPKTLVAPFP